MRLVWRATNPTLGGSPDGAIPNLAGQQKRYLERQLAVFRSGARVYTAMQIIAAHKTFDDQHNIAAVADYLSRLQANPKPVEGSGEHLRLGQEIYSHICAACHGDDGRGAPANRVPRIAGQHYPYLQRQIEAAASLHKDLAPPEMTSALRGMGLQEKDALATTSRVSVNPKGYEIPTAPLASENRQSPERHCRRNSCIHKS